MEDRDPLLPGRLRPTRLLRARGERPSGCRSTDQRHEFASSHRLGRAGERATGFQLQPSKQVFPTGEIGVWPE
jgi:hypothetical protein